MFCSKCGAQLAEGTLFCTSCGQPVGGLPAPAAVPSTHASPSVEPGGGVPVYQSVPTAAPLPSPYAGFWLRVVAHIIDGLTLGVFLGVIVLIGIAFIGVGALRSAIEGMNNSDAEPSVALVLMLIFVAFVGIFAWWIYNAYMESSPNQGTLGKMALGLIVTDTQGRRISFAHASGRFFAGALSRLIPLGIAYMMAGFTEKKQALHDMIAGCLVLRKN
jgi:uncharacterized RDD family membrane protein YckC